MKINRYNYSVPIVFIALITIFMGFDLGKTVYAAPAVDVPCTGVQEEVAFAGVGSGWKLCVSTIDKFGLIITNAYFKTSPSSPYIKVLGDGRIGEIFVVYHTGTPRFKDIAEFNFSKSPMSVGDCPEPHVILGVLKRICREHHDSGVAWRNDDKVRRGQEVLYWGSLDAANYNYVMEWKFRDDGAISVRAGSTGPKLGSEPNTGHAHNFTWRLDFDLNGPGNDSVFINKHLEDIDLPISTAQDTIQRIDTESGLIWHAREFNTLEIRDSTLKNGNGRPTGYQLLPLRSGTSRHSEAVTRKDFWVTRFSAGELLAFTLPTYLNSESTVDQDIVVWYTASAHHENNMRDEDKDTVPVIWVGFLLEPQNLFSRTPFYVP